jgi:hypothetical protein
MALMHTFICPYYYEGYLFQPWQSGTIRYGDDTCSNAGSVFDPIG